jgi:hypothetical protein
MRFALELYNFSSTWHDDEDTRKQVDKLRAVVDNISANLNHSPPAGLPSDLPPILLGEDQSKTKSKTGETP